ncbi:hypothetical protein REPUB_Repub06bG0195500 [Reevesia pubescens]
MTLNWDGLRDDDDEFFESCDRISSFVPQDLASSGSDDDDKDFDDCRISLSSTVSSVHNSQFRGFATTAAGTPMSPDYNIWMASPRSIKERRQQFFQGLGLSPNKEPLSFKRFVSTKVPNAKEFIVKEHDQDARWNKVSDLQTGKFSIDTRFLASAGEDKIILVWEVQECKVIPMSEGSLTPLHPSLASSPLHPSLATSPLHPLLLMSLDQSGLLEAADHYVLSRAIWMMFWTCPGLYLKFDSQNSCH